MMVWVHGGSLRTGESNDYNPAGLVRDGVVVVTINYRLGALGFLADAALASRPGGPSGNYGLVLGAAAGREEDLRRRTPLRVALGGADHAGSYVFLASDRARGITGTVLHSDGGIGVSGR